MLKEHIETQCHMFTLRTLIVYKLITAINTRELTKLKSFWIEKNNNTFLLSSRLENRKRKSSINYMYVV